MQQQTTCMINDLIYDANPQNSSIIRRDRYGVKECIKMIPYRYGKKLSRQSVTTRDGGPNG